jgi:hypothetical protein
LKKFLGPRTSVIEVTEPGTYYFRVKAVNGVEEGEYSNSVKVNIGLESLPYMINNVSSYPNPFDSRKQNARINYTLKEDVDVEVMIYDALGNLVKKWKFEKGLPGGEAGTNEIIWDGTNGIGEKVSTGIYLCLIKANSNKAGNRVIYKIAVKH